MPVSGSKIWEELHGLAEGGILVEVEHVKAHRTKKEKEKCRSLRSLSLKATRRLMSWQKKEHCWMEGFLAETMQQEREEVYAALQYAASFHGLTEQWKECEELEPEPKEKWIFVDQKREELKHRTEWCAEADGYRCMRWERGSKYLEMAGKCTGPKIFRIVWKNGEDDIWEVMTWKETWTGKGKS